MSEDYETLRGRQLAAMRELVPEYVGRTRWPAGRIRAERQAALRRLLRVAIDGSPWHRRRLTGIDPESCTVADLASVPVMTKDDLVTNFDEVVTDRRVTAERVERHLAALGDQDAYLLDAYHVAVSGGSSGRRATFVFDWESWQKYFLALFRYIYRDPRSATGRGGKAPLVVGLTASSSGHISSSLRQTFSPREPAAIGLPVLDPLEKNVRRLNEIQPDVLFTYPSILRPLVAEKRAGRLRVDPMAIISSAEPLPEDLADTIAATWPDTVVFNWYAASEGGCIAAGCGVGRGLHVSDDLVILEAVDADGRPVPPGVRSDKVYLTNLANTLMPLVRYELDDQVTYLPDERCPCGSEHRRIANVHGRQRETFRYAGGVRVHALSLYGPLTFDPSVVEFQVRQTRTGVTVLVRGTDPDTDRITRDLAAALAAAGLADPEVTVEVVDRLDRLATSGKLVRFVPLPEGAPR